MSNDAKGSIIASIGVTLAFTAKIAILKEPDPRRRPGSLLPVNTDTPTVLAIEFSNWLRSRGYEVVRTEVVSTYEKRGSHDGS